MVIVMLMVVDASDDTNRVFHPCSDTRIQRLDGFSFGIAFASRDSFYFNQSQQLSPCDGRLSLSSNSQLAVFRPKVDEISLLTVNTSSFFPVLILLHFGVYFSSLFHVLGFSTMLVFVASCVSLILI